MSRIVSWFSCGAASAVATKLAIANSTTPVTVAYCKVREEHPDNERFLKDCEEWFGQKIVVLMNEAYDGSIFNVFEKNYMRTPAGSPCTRALKKQVRQKFELPTDRQVFGYTIEEVGRLDRFIDANNSVDVWPILIEKRLTKAECLAMVANAGIELPEMYRLGYNNNNCIGCVKGGIGYWNKIRVDFPDHFNRMAELEVRKGYTVLKDKTGPIFLRDLDPRRGNHQNEVTIDCGIACLSAEAEYSLYEEN
jgi:hypothetical protein